ncbi:MAG: TIGR00725 family protein [Clostridia bacterium]|nr:TIGR00725 family protein [Clostridia bacterium]
MKAMGKKIYIGVVGSGNCDKETADIAERVGQLLAKEGAVVICGGYGGVMEACSRGAASAGGMVIGVLSEEDRRGANPYLSASLVTGMGQARNAIIVGSSHAVIAISGGYGTLSEIALALKMNRPVIGINTWKIDQGDGKEHIICADNPEEAVKIALEISREISGFVENDF